MRRVGLASALIHLLIINILVSFSLPAKTIKGTVFHDLNKNLKLDKGEPGIPGVLVSNQKEVVRTDGKGRYKIPVYDECIIFITKPADYMTPVDENNLPQFYYIYQPQGSPDLKYPGVAPTGRLPRRLNFPLFRSELKDTFEVIVLGDPQSSDEKEVGYLRDDVIAELIGSNASFGIALGDIVFDDLSLYSLQNKVVSQAGFPFYYVPGNHDQNYDSPDDRYALETFKSVYGPPYYSFAYGKVHFLVLDNVEYLGRDENGRASYQGKIGDKQLQWIKNTVSFIPADHLIVFLMHIPLFTDDGTNAVVNTIDRKDLFKIVKDRKYLLSLVGHMHTVEHHYLGKDIGWEGEKPLHELICAAGCGAWWKGPKDIRGIPVAIQQDGAPNGYHVFEFAGHDYRERLKPASQAADYQMRISFPQGSLTVDDLAEKKIIVNVFDGGERSVVKFKIDDLPAEMMTREFREEPFVVDVYNRVKDEMPSWLEPKSSTHVWTAPFPQQLGAGVHKIVVTSRDQFGNLYQSAKIFEIK